MHVPMGVRRRGGEVERRMRVSRCTANKECDKRASERTADRRVDRAIDRCSRTSRIRSMETAFPPSVPHCDALFLSVLVCSPFFPLSYALLLVLVGGAWSLVTDGRWSCHNVCCDRTIDHRPTPATAHKRKDRKGHRIGQREGTHCNGSHSVETRFPTSVNSRSVDRRFDRPFACSRSLVALIVRSPRRDIRIPRSTLELASSRP